MPHLEFTLLMAVMLSAALALVGKRTRAERVYAGVYRLLCCCAAVAAGSWGMWLIHR